MEALFAFWPKLFRKHSDPTWVASSVPIGAGQPDLVATRYHTTVHDSAGFSGQHARLLAYLRKTSYVKHETITHRVGICSKELIPALTELTEAGALRQQRDKYALAPGWRDPLPEVTTVEAKVSKWKDAVLQARRNALFVHRSYVALPEALARRVHRDKVFKEYGIGVLAVFGGGSIQVLRHACKQSPLLWQYYYLLAFAVARSYETE